MKKYLAHRRLWPWSWKQSQCSSSDSYITENVIYSRKWHHTEGCFHLVLTLVFSNLIRNDVRNHSGLSGSCWPKLSSFSFSKLCSQRQKRFGHCRQNVKVKSQVRIFLLRQGENSPRVEFTEKKGEWQGQHGCDFQTHFLSSYSSSLIVSFNNKYITLTRG